MNQQEYDDGELLDEQIMLKALLAEAEDTIDTQTEFTEKSPDSKPALTATPLKQDSHSIPTSKRVLTSLGNDQSTSSSAPLQKSTSKSSVKSSVEVKGNAPSALTSQSVEPTKTQSTPRINQMDIKLTFSLGESLITYNELMNLKPGQILNLGKTFTSPISIYSHNNLLATAEIVDIEGSVGVRIQTMANK
jgi:flagellar motor switch/type III secretory pathway protein FliN